MPEPKAVEITFWAADDGEAQNIINEVSGLATDKGLNLLGTDVDDPEWYHKVMAAEAGLIAPPDPE
jgi:hypothetical protein